MSSHYDEDFLSEMMDYVKDRSGYWHRRHHGHYPIDDYESLGLERLSYCLIHHDSNKGSLEGYIKVSVNNELRGLPRSQKKHDYTSIDSPSDEDDYSLEIPSYDNSTRTDAKTNVIPILREISYNQQNLLEKYLSGSTITELAKSYGWVKERVVSEVNLSLAKLRQRKLRDQKGQISFSEKRES